MRCAQHEEIDIFAKKDLVLAIGLVNDRIGFVAVLVGGGICKKTGLKTLGGKISSLKTKDLWGVSHYKYLHRVFETIKQYPGDFFWGSLLN